MSSRHRVLSKMLEHEAQGKAEAHLVEEVVAQDLLGGFYGSRIVLGIEGRLHVLLQSRQHLGTQLVATGLDALLVVVIESPDASACGCSLPMCSPWHR